MTPSREELLQSIRPEMKLNKNFFLRIYGYSITTPEFAAEALDKLEAAGCSKAHTYYDKIVKEYEAGYQKMLRAVAQEYARELEREWKQREKEGDQHGSTDRGARYQFAGLPQDW